MLGAMVGDIVGSRFEFNNHRSKDFELFSDGCFATDDSIMTLAVAKAIMEADKIASRDNPKYCDNLREFAVKYMRKIGRNYPNCGFGGMFYKWVFSDTMGAYNSFGNGAAMRVSPCGFAARTEAEALLLAKTVTEVTHNHPEGIKGAEATALAIFLARNSKNKDEIKTRIEADYYKLNFTIDEIHPTYEFNETCQETVLQAIQCFLESNDFEDAIRTAISLGGDSDTIGAITCAIAEAFYGVPDEICENALKYLDKELFTIYNEWCEYLPKIHTSIVIDLPKKDELTREIKKLRTELSMLVLERDDLILQECKTIEMDYMLTLGGVEYKAYELHCEVLRLKRKLELIQAARNRQEIPNPLIIEAILEREFAEYKAKLDEEIGKMNNALKRSHNKTLTDEEVIEFKKMYRVIVKALHPDLHPDISNEKIDILKTAINAYENGNLTELRVIYDMVGGSPVNDLPDIGAELLKEKSRLEKSLKAVREQIADIKNTYPYNLKKILTDPQKIAEIKAAAEKQIAELTVQLDYYKTKLAEKAV
jgi:ADP-ribosylglycohydrolase